MRVFAPLNFVSGRGTPAISATLQIKGSPTKLSPRYNLDKAGLENLVAGLPTPSGFPSRINAEVPGSIRGGGESRYALAVVFGPVSRSARMNIVLLAPTRMPTSRNASELHNDWIYHLVPI